MTEPTDKEIVAFAVENGMHVRTGRGAVKFARAVLAKWGQQPLRYDQSPTLFTVFAKCDEYEGEVPLAQYSATSEYGVLDRVMGDARNAGYTGHAKDRMTELGWRIVPVYATPQPVARDPLTDSQAQAGAVPLTDEQIEALPMWKRFVGLWPETRREIVRIIESAHGIGIKGGQHGTDI